MLPQSHSTNLVKQKQFQYLVTYDILVSLNHTQHKIWEKIQKKEHFSIFGGVVEHTGYRFHRLSGDLTVILH